MVAPINSKPSIFSACNELAFTSSSRSSLSSACSSSSSDASNSLKLDQLLDLLEIERQKLHEKIGNTFLINLGLDALENKYGIPALNELIAITVSKARVEGDIIVGWLKEKQEFRGGTTAANTNWKIDLIDRALVLEGIIPATEYYAISPILYKGYIDFTLTPVL